jgi:hypothetical protein
MLRQGSIFLLMDYLADILHRRELPRRIAPLVEQPGIRTMSFFQVTAIASGMLEKRFGSGVPLST